MHISVVTWLYQIIWVYKGQELRHLQFGKHIKFLMSFCYRECATVFLEISSLQQAVLAIITFLQSLP